MNLTPWAKSADGKILQLFDVKLPVRLKVVEHEAERAEWLEAFYSNVFVNAFRSADSFYEKLSHEYLNISRDQVREFLKHVETRQLTLPVREIKIQI